MKTNYSGMFKETKINTSDCGKFCDDSCPNLFHNGCDIFSGTLVEQSESKRIFSEEGRKLRWNACKKGTEIFRLVLNMG
jgi:hypothetical protein